MQLLNAQLVTKKWHPGEILERMATIFMQSVYMEPRYNEPPYITNGQMIFLASVIVKYMEKNLDITKPPSHTGNISAKLVVQHRCVAS